MTRLGRLITILVSTFIAFIVAAQVFERSRAEIDTLQALGFEDCNGKPCLLGILPGTTSLQEAKTILARQDNIALRDKHYTISFENNDIELRLFSTDYLTFQSGGSALYPIEIEMRNSHVPLRAVIEKYGSPCGVAIYPVQCNTYNTCSGLEWMTIYYESMIISIDLDPQRGLQLTTLNPDVPIERIELVNPAASQNISGVCHTFVPDEIGSTMTPWLGFASLKRYMSYENHLAVTENLNR
jgi:hypothetical protein